MAATNKRVLSSRANNNSLFSCDRFTKIDSDNERLCCSDSTSAISLSSSSSSSKEAANVANYISLVNISTNKDNDIYNEEDDDCGFGCEDDLNYYDSSRYCRFKVNKTLLKKTAMKQIANGAQDKSTAINAIRDKCSHQYYTRYNRHRHRHLHHHNYPNQYQKHCEPAITGCSVGTPTLTATSIRSSRNASHLLSTLGPSKNGTTITNNNSNSNSVQRPMCQVKSGATASIIARPTIIRSVDTLKLCTQLVLILTIVPSTIISSQLNNNSANENNIIIVASNRPTASDFYNHKSSDKTVDDRPKGANQFNKRQQSINVSRRWPDETTTTYPSEEQLQFGPKHQSQRGKENEHLHLHLHQLKQQQQSLTSAGDTSSSVAGNLVQTADINQFRDIGRFHRAAEAAPQSITPIRGNGVQSILTSLVANQGHRVRSLVNNTLADLVSQSANRLTTGSQGLLFPQHQLLQQQAFVFGANQHQLQQSALRQHQQPMQLQQQQHQQQHQVIRQQQPATLQLLQQSLAGGARFFPTTTMGRLYTFLFPNSSFAQQQMQRQQLQQLSIINYGEGQQSETTPTSLSSAAAAGPLLADNQTSVTEPIQFASSNNHDLYFAVERPPLKTATKIVAANQTSNQSSTFLLPSEKHIISLSAPYEASPTIARQSARTIQTIDQSFEGASEDEGTRWRGDNETTAASINNGDVLASDQQAHQLIANANGIGAGDTETPSQMSAVGDGGDNESLEVDGSGLVQMNSNLSSQAEFEQMVADSAASNQQQQQQQAAGSFDGNTSDLQQLSESEAAQYALAEQAESGSVFGVRQQHQQGRLEANNNSSIIRGSDSATEDTLGLSGNQSLVDYHHLKLSSGEEMGELQQSQSGGELLGGDDEHSMSISSSDDIAQLQQANLLTLNTNRTAGESINPDDGESNETPASDADESYVTIQLPSQYDAVIRVPPEGYYDDYFKPASESSSLHSGDSSSMPSNANQESASFPLQFENHESATSTYEQLTSPASNDNATMAQGEQKQQMVSLAVKEKYSNETEPNASMISQPSQPQQQQQKEQQQRENEDSIQLIIANTNSSARDPLSNEKIINYISEPGFNITRPIGKSPRHTFVNKDMNEFPPVDDHHTSHMSQQQQQRRPISTVQGLQQVDKQRHSQLSSINGGGGQPGNNSGNNGGGDHGYGYSHVYDVQPLVDDEDELKRVPTGSSASVAAENGNFGRYNNSTADKVFSRDNAQAAVVGAARRLPSSSEEFASQRGYDDQMERSSNENSYARSSRKQRTYSKGYEAQQQKQPRGVGTEKNGRNIAAAVQRRPQMTQANFNPKDLILNPPTARPKSITENAMESIAELPNKMKKLHNNQPDKNELMNELLTALDRVKVAIYKLQPLTAKMNAIYRKSVTSNTRNIIMDNNKGTYAKRYPPGDYDDAYDRLNPSELLERQQLQQATAAGPRRGRGVQQRPATTTTTTLEASASSATSATHIPSPRGHQQQPTANNSKTHNNIYNSNHQRHLRIARAVDQQQRASLTADSSEASKEGNDKSSQPIVATGIGRRLADGRIRGELRLTSHEYNERNLPTINSNYGVNSNSATTTAQIKRAAGSMLESDGAERAALIDSAAPDFVPPDQLLDESEPQSPLFGYRITIFQSEPTDLSDEEAKNNEQFSYEIDGFEQPNASDDSISSGSSKQQQIAISGNSSSSSSHNLVPLEDNDDDDDDVMATSESSISESFQIDPSLARKTAVAGGYSPSAEGLDVQESKGKKMKEEWKKEKGGEEKEHKKKGAKAKEENKKEKSKKDMSKKKKDEEESKRKKEYKKVKHNKGIVSKEKKSMHRVKHVRAHDRGAAKEKALKERTQIEFFEREQIVDDEFEKGKKSTTKAGWQSGHDSKKSTNDMLGGDTMSMGGSYYVHHEPKDQEYSASGHGVSVETSNAKQSNKFEKKNMESKGKKFKGWREKGYKIITETEFIDRGSLHDSGYKKRDKGAAHHQKFKKQESSSEGHHGSMQEIQKKSHKKEEKESRMHEKKGKQSKKNEEFKKGKKKDEKLSVEKKKKKSNDHDHDHEESVVRAANVDPNNVSGDSDEDSDDKDLVEGKESASGVRKQQVPPMRNYLQTIHHQPMLASPSTFRPALSKFVALTDSADDHLTLSSSSALMRLLNANHNEESPIKLDKMLGYRNFTNPDDNNHSNSSNNITMTNHHQQHYQRPSLDQIKYQILTNSNDDSALTSNMDSSNRRSDVVGGNSLPLIQLGPVPAAQKQTTNSSSKSSAADAALELVANLTGRQSNRAKITGVDRIVDHNIRAEHDQQATKKNSAHGSGSGAPLLMSLLEKADALLQQQQRLQATNSLNKQSDRSLLFESKTQDKPPPSAAGFESGAAQLMQPVQRAANRQHQPVGAITVRQQPQTSNLIEMPSSIGQPAFLPATLPSNAYQQAQLYLAPQLGFGLDSNSFEGSLHDYEAAFDGALSAHLPQTLIID